MTRGNSRIIPTVADGGGPWICALTGTFAGSDLAVRRGTDPRGGRMVVVGVDGWARRVGRRPAGTGLGEGVVGHGLAHDREARRSGPSMRPRSRREVKGSGTFFLGRRICRSVQCDGWLGRCVLGVGPGADKRGSCTFDPDHGRGYSRRLP